MNKIKVLDAKLVCNYFAYAQNACETSEKENPTKREQRSIIINIKFNGFCLCAIRMKIGLGCVALNCIFTYQIQYSHCALTIRTIDGDLTFIIHT